MKKLLPIFLLLALLLASCGNSSGTTRITLKQYIAFMDAKLSADEMPTFSEAAPSSPKEADGQLKYDYFIDSYNLVTVYTETETEHITKIFISTASRSAPQEELGLFAYICGLTFSLIDPKDGQAISDELGFTNITTTGARSAYSEAATYMYSVDDGLSMLIGLK